MVKVIQGKRAGKNGKLAVGCSAAVFDESHERLLLICRADDGKWAVPGGYMEAGEDFSEACAREVFEETGLQVKVQRLISIYTAPNLLLEYADGNRWQLVILHFEVKILGGKLTPSDESTELNFYKMKEISTLEMGNLDRCRVEDSFAVHMNAIIRNEFGL
jgi:ADP-ribose pyrophosphatase YjhB (NUDIX family)